MVVNEARRWFVAESGMLAAVVFFWWSRVRLTEIGWRWFASFGNGFGYGILCVDRMWDRQKWNMG